MTKKLQVGIIGYGYWGPNIVRNFCQHNDATVKYVADLDLQRIDSLKKIYPQIITTHDYKIILNDPDIDAVAIVTPLTTHFQLAKDALEAGKHVFMEKPMAETSEQCQELLTIAERKKRIMMVGHIFVYSNQVKKIKELLEKKELGNIFYFDSVRTNLGPYRTDTNVVWDLATHDIAILEYLFKKKPIFVSAIGANFFGTNHCDVAYVSIMFENNFIANININWIAPTKIRKIVIGGSEKMLLWDDIEVETKIKIYDKGIIMPSNNEKMYNAMIQYRIGDMYSPRVDITEALTEEINHFCECVLNNKNPLSDGVAGMNVIKILGAIDISLKGKGKPVYF